MLVLQSKSYVNRPVTLLYTYVPKGQFPRLLELSQAQMTSPIKILSPANHPSPRTLTHLMPLLELRHVQPDEALCGNKHESNWQDGKYPQAFRPHHSGSPIPFLYVLSGSLPLFLSTQSLHDSIPYHNEPSHVPVLLNWA